jgi:hypothetical protein
MEMTVTDLEDEPGLRLHLGDWRIGVSGKAPGYITEVGGVGGGTNKPSPQHPNIINESSLLLLTPIQCTKFSLRNFTSLPQCNSVQCSNYWSYIDWAVLDMAPGCISLGFFFSPEQC